MKRPNAYGNYCVATRAPAAPHPAHKQSIRKEEVVDVDDALLPLPFTAIQKNFASLNYEPDETEVWRHHEAKRHYKDGAR